MLYIMLPWASPFCPAQYVSSMFFEAIQKKTVVLQVLSGCASY